MRVLISGHSFLKIPNVILVIIIKNNDIEYTSSHIICLRSCTEMISHLCSSIFYAVSLFSWIQ